MTDQSPTRRRLRSRVTALVTAVALGAVGAIAGATSAEASGGTLTVTAYDAAGAALTGQEILDIARNKDDNIGNDYTSKVIAALVDPSTLEDLNPVNSPLVPTVHSGDLAFTLPDEAAALSITWPTSPTRGYSTLFVDNLGAGFSASTTINLTYRAALDLKAQYDAALSLRLAASPAYSASAAFTTAAATLATDYTAMTTAVTESDRGRLGWTVLADIHLAYDLLLSEYGGQLAKYKDEHDMGSPWLGTTFDDATASNTNTRLGFAQNATVPTGVSPNPQYGWVRIVFDVGTPPADYASAVKKAHNKGLLVMGMPFDSTSARACKPVANPTHCTAAEYETRFETFVDYFSNNTNAALNIDAWEVGNEINGEWIDEDPVSGSYVLGSGEMDDKVSTAADYVHTNTSALTVATLYWQVPTSNRPQNSTFSWAQSQLIDEGYASKFDVVLLSTYIEDAPLGTGFDRVMSRLASMFGGSQIGLGEFDYFYTDTSRYFWSLTHLTYTSTQAQAKAARPALATLSYLESLAYPSSVGGGFWWYFQEESTGAAGTNLQNAIKAVADKVYFG
ncbi:MAG: hypothetical protein KF727_12360 [Microbacteriaceae bacterium]|nr:hypothetical protein [Microbacteriaceae bacterium]